MKILKIKQSKNGKCFYNYYYNCLFNTPKYIVELTQSELDLLLTKIKEVQK